MKPVFDFPLSRLHCQIWMSPNTKPALAELRPVLKNLAWVHNEYTDQLAQPKKLNDCTFWHRERPQVGWFAAAVWKSGGVALEEYKATKLSDGANTLGRGDLYFRFKGTGYLCESKHAWISIREGDRVLTPFAQAVDQAHKDARRGIYRERKLALTFGSAVIDSCNIAGARQAFTALAQRVALEYTTPRTAVVALRLNHQPLQAKKQDPNATYGLITCVHIA